MGFVGGLTPTPESRSRVGHREGEAPGHRPRTCPSNLCKRQAARLLRLAQFRPLRNSAAAPSTISPGRAEDAGASRRSSLWQSQRRTFGKDALCMDLETSTHSLSLDERGESSQRSIRWQATDRPQALRSCLSHANSQPVKTLARSSRTRARWRTSVSWPCRRGNGPSKLHHLGHD